jgi:hypothetical protein
MSRRLGRRQSLNAASFDAAAATSVAGERPRRQTPQVRRIFRGWILAACLELSLTVAISIFLLGSHLGATARLQRSRILRMSMWRSMQSLTCFSYALSFHLILRHFFANIIWPLSQTFVAWFRDQLSVSASQSWEVRYWLSCSMRFSPSTADVVDLGRWCPWFRFRDRQCARVSSRCLIRINH